MTKPTALHCHSRSFIHFFLFLNFFCLYGNTESVVIAQPNSIVNENSSLEELKNIDNTNLFLLLEKSKHNQQVEDICKKRLEEDIPRETQSGGHVKLRIEQIITHNIAWKYDSEIEQLIKQASKKEQQFNATGKFVLYHGMKKELHFLCDMYTKLWEIKHKKLAENFLFLRFYDENDNLIINKSSEKIGLEKIKRGWKFDLSKNLIFFHEKETSDMLYEHNRILFANGALLANIVGKEKIDCSLRYVHQNDNYQAPEISIRKIFKAHNMENFYFKYKEEIEKLESLNNKAGRGRLIQIVLTDQQLRDCTYTINKWWHRFNVDIKGLGNVSGNYGVPTILRTLIEYPESIENENDWQYAIALTDEYMLNPYSGIQMHVYYTCDKAAYLEYILYRDALFSKIKKDFDEIKFEATISQLTNDLMTTKEQLNIEKERTQKLNRENLFLSNKLLNSRYNVYIGMAIGSIITTSITLIMLKIYRPIQQLLKKRFGVQQKSQKKNPKNISLTATP